MKEKVIKKQVSEYVAVFEPDQRVGGYSVSIPALPGCISEGDTFEEALANIREAAQLYVEVMQQTKGKDWLKKESRVIIAPVQVAF
ncbi:MAG: type II toxin-antitoxin system HicB family antitoxin [Candidatus Magasanikbacteria bacterium]|nr:type II toxin-antitoxin system HicB family antitoxin [Candidatus Magasanikbacteria bacterium]